MSERTNREELEQNNAYAQSKRMKRIIISVFAGMIGFIVLFYILSSVIDIDTIIANIGGNKYNPTKPTIVFVTPNYDEDIYKDAVYIGLDRNIYIYDINTGVTESLESDDYEAYGDGVKFMADFVNFIIEGDAESYNKCFENECFYNDSVEEKEAFTMQKLYNIKITRMSEDDVSENGQNYTKYEFVLEYMIHQNNGTFRTDIGSDASKKQYITLTDRTGNLLISKTSY